MEPGFPYCHVAKDWRADYNGEIERESVTKLYFKPEPAAPPAFASARTLEARTFEVTDRFQLPSIVIAPQAAPRKVREIRRSKQLRRPAIGMVVGAVCVLVGIVIGGAIAAGGPAGGTAAAAAAIPAPALPSHVVMTTTARPAKLTVTPIEPAPITAPPPITAPDPAIVAPAPVPAPVQAIVVAPIVAAPAHHHHHAAPAAPAPAELGRLAISSKPPCKIEIDGRDTGLTAPQKAIELPAGRHEITLSNAEEGIQLTTEVVVTAAHTSQLIRDFTK
jgi:hypothetical protein